jgi:hypothetical protein
VKSWSHLFLADIPCRYSLQVDGAYESELGSSRVSSPRTLSVTRPALRGAFVLLTSMTLIRRERPIGEAGRKARTARADARASELAPIIAELREAGITSLRAVATELSRRGIPTATGIREWQSAQVRRMLARL